MSDAKERAKKAWERVEQTFPLDAPPGRAMRFQAAVQAESAVTEERLEDRMAKLEKGLEGLAFQLETLEGRIDRLGAPEPSSSEMRGLTEEEAESYRRVRENVMEPSGGEREEPPGYFWLDRLEDETGISGTGKIAEGVEFSDGKVVMRWLTRHRSTCYYDSMEEVRAIHGHEGKTVIRRATPSTETGERVDLSGGAGGPTYGVPLDPTDPPEPEEDGLARTVRTTATILRRIGEGGPAPSMGRLVERADRLEEAARRLEALESREVVAIPDWLEEQAESLKLSGDPAYWLCAAALEHAAGTLRSSPESPVALTRAKTPETDG